jgi:hypothetical protein
LCGGPVLLYVPAVLAVIVGWSPPPWCIAIFVVGLACLFYGWCAFTREIWRERRRPHHPS